LFRGADEVGSTVNQPRFLDVASGVAQVWFILPFTTSE
jgi:hypothetical protein